MSTTATRLTVEQFLATPEREDVKQELIDGEIVEVSTGGPRHETVKANFIGELALYFRNERRRKVYSETMYRLSENDSPIPDVSVVLSGNLDPDRTGKTTAIPDIVIEVVSSESAAVLQKKVKVYLDRGVRAVWVAYPELRLIDVYKKDGVERLRAGLILEDAELLPGFSTPVEAFFENLP